MKRSHIVSILKNNRFMCNKTKNKNKKLFCKYCLQCFSKGRVLLEHKEICLKINGRQILKWRSDSIKFTNYFKQLAVLFNIYANFKSFLKGVRGSDKKTILHALRNIRDIFLSVLPLLMINLANHLLFTGEKLKNRFIEVFLKSMDIAKKW